MDPRASVLTSHADPTPSRADASRATPSEDPSGSRGLPRGALAGAVALVVLAVLSVAGLRLSGADPAAAPVATAAPTAVVMLRFADRADGAVVVRDADSDAVIAVLDEGPNAFLRGVMRSLVRQRRMEGVDAAPPFRLTRFADGRLWLEDPATQERIDLGAFGPDNIAVFASLLAAAEASDARLIDPDRREDTP